MTLDELRDKYNSMTTAQRDALEAKYTRMDAQDDETERWAALSPQERRWEAGLDRADMGED